MPIKRTKKLTPEQLVHALLSLEPKDTNAMAHGAAEVAIKTGITEEEGLDILSKIGMYALENRGFKK